VAVAGFLCASGDKFLYHGLKTHAHQTLVLPAVFCMLKPAEAADARYGRRWEMTRYWRFLSLPFAIRPFHDIDMPGISGCRAFRSSQGLSIQKIVPELDVVRH